MAKIPIVVQKSDGINQQIVYLHTFLVKEQYTKQLMRFS